MNDDALSPELELASAYLDGDVDDAQRAEVESSPELMALVASFQQVKGTLRDLPPMDATARDAAVAAALAEFDVLRAPPAAAAFAGTAVTAPDNVVPLQRRTRLSRVLMSAAAVLLIGGVGVVAVNSMGGSSSDQSSGAADPAATKIAASDSATESAADQAGGGATPQTINAINGAASAVPDLDEPQDLATFAAAPAPTAAATETTAAAAETTAAAAATETISDAGGATETIAAEAAQPVAATRAIVPSFVFDCPLEPSQVIVAEITWKGVPAVAVRDTVTGVIEAVDAQCTVLASVQT